jgi:hypothetical protein
MILLMLSAIIGGACSFVGLLLQYGVLIALLGSPFGGSIAALLAGIYLGFVRSQPENSWQVQTISEFAVPE